MGSLFSVTSLTKLSELSKKQAKQFGKNIDHRINLHQVCLSLSQEIIKLTKVLAGYIFLTDGKKINRLKKKRKVKNNIRRGIRF